MTTRQHYLKALTRSLERQGQLAELDPDPNPEQSVRRPQRPLLIKIGRRLLRYFRRIGTLLNGTYRRDYWLPSRDLPLLHLDRASPVLDEAPDVAVHLHIYFLDLFPELLEALGRLPCPATVYATTDTQAKADAVSELLSEHPRVCAHETIITPNRGRDIGPWLVEMAKYSDQHEIWCHLHTKKSLHAPKIGQSWRQFLLGNLMGSEQSIRSILSAFQADPKLGLVTPPFHTKAVKEEFLGWDDLPRAQALFESLEIGVPFPRHPFFPAGAMFWYRGQAMAPLFRAGMDYGDFEEEQGQISLTLMHTLERIVPYVVASSGYGYLVTIPGKH